MRILWVKSDLLHPLDRGGRIRTYGILRALKPDHHITYVALDDGVTRARREAAAEYAHDVRIVPHPRPPTGGTRLYLEAARNLFSDLPYSLSRYRSHALGRTVSELLARRPADVVVCDFLTPWPSLASVRDLPPVVLFEHNVEAVIWERRAATARSYLERLYFGLQARRMARVEGQAVRRAGSVVAVSNEDARLLRERYAADRVTVVETGVDAEYFTPGEGAREEDDHLVFVGSMDWTPNQDAVIWFVEKILPLVRRERPDARLTIVGRRPSPAVCALGERNSAVVVTGAVPDVRPYLERAAAVIVPLRVGSGTRLKIYEALAAGKAVVSTTVGAEGLPTRDGEHLVRADTPARFAEAVTQLLADSELRRRLGANGRRLVETRFTWDAVARTFATVCRETVCAPRAA